MQNETSCDRIVASFQDERRIDEGILEENDMNIVIMVKEVLIQRQKSSIMNLDTMVKHIQLMDYSI